MHAQTSRDRTAVPTAPPIRKPSGRTSAPAPQAREAIATGLKFSRGAGPLGDDTGVGWPATGSGSAP